MTPYSTIIHLCSPQRVTLSVCKHCKKKVAANKNPLGLCTKMPIPSWQWWILLGSNTCKWKSAGLASAADSTIHVRPHVGATQIAAAPAPTAAGVASLLSSAAQGQGDRRSPRVRRGSHSSRSTPHARSCRPESCMPPPSSCAAPADSCLACNCRDRWPATTSAPRRAGQLLHAQRKH